MSNPHHQPSLKPNSLFSLTLAAHTEAPASLMLLSLVLTADVVLRFYFRTSLGSLRGCEALSSGKSVTKEPRGLSHDWDAPEKLLHREARDCQHGHASVGNFRLL